MKTMIMFDILINEEAVRESIDILMKHSDELFILHRDIKDSKYKDFIESLRINYTILPVNKNTHNDVVLSLCNHMDRVIVVGENGIYTDITNNSINVMNITSSSSFSVYNDSPDEEVVDLQDINKFDIWKDSSYKDIVKSLSIYTRKKLLKTLSNTTFLNADKDISKMLWRVLYSKGIFVPIKDINHSRYTNEYNEVTEGYTSHPISDKFFNSACDAYTLEHIRNIVNPNPKSLNVLYNKSREMEKAIGLIDKHKNNKIAIVTDSDCDGLTSETVGYKYLKEELGYDVITINTERRYGNGFSDEMLRRVLNDRDIKLVITADMGSGDNDRYLILKSRKIDVIVTDHHHFQDLPIDADAFVNCMYPFAGLPTFISGCTVLYSLFLNYNRYLTGKENTLDNLVPMVAISIIGDMMPLNKGINRFLYKLGMELLEEKVIAKALNITNITMDTLSFKLISLINATNRMGDATLGYKFLASENIHTAEIHLKSIISLDNKKKKIVKDLLKNAHINTHSNLTTCKVDTEQDGLLGLLAARLSDTNAVVLAYREKAGVCKGSLRTSTKDIKLTNVLSDNSKYLTKFGGHDGAAGLTFNSSELNNVINFLSEASSGIKITVEEGIAIPINVINSPTLFSYYKELEPYGMDFTKPVLTVEGIVTYKSDKGITTTSLADDNGVEVRIKSFKRNTFQKGDVAKMNIVYRDIKEKEIWENT